jgi:hypothetical protein
VSRDRVGAVIDAFGAWVEGALPSDRLASFVWERLEGGADGEVVNQLFEATGELGLNVVEHAGSPAGGFVAAQRYKAGMPEDRIIVAVGDVGVGIRESLRPRYGDMTEDEAIRRAIQWHVSRIPDEGRGQGLPASSTSWSRPCSWTGAAAAWSSRARPSGRSSWPAGRVQPRRGRPPETG